MRSAILALLMFCAVDVYAQSGYGTTTVYDRGQKDLPTDSVHYTLPANQFYHKQPWKDSVYRFPEFQVGKLEFANGFSPTTRLVMNYNIFLESIEVVDENKQINLLKKFAELKFIYIGDHKFYYVPSLGYLELVLDGKISVAKRTIMASLYELSTGFKYRIVGLDVKTTTNRYTRYYWPVELYYILDPDYRTYRAGSLVLPSIVPELKDRIKDFVEVNDINYRNHSDVLRVVRFVNALYEGPEMSAASKKMIRIPSNIGLEQSTWRDSIYRFKEFAEASITYQDGSREMSDVVMNHNLATGRFDMISKRGDTIALSPPKKILLANANDVSFMNDDREGILEVVMQGNVGLALKKRIVLDEERPTEKIYRIEKMFFFINKNRAVITSARTILNLFPSHKNDITKYISTYNPNFESKADMVKLLSYCATL